MATAPYIAQRDADARRVQWLIEIDLDRCSLNYTTSPCAAVDLGDGLRCAYSFPTCQDVANFARSTKTWRFHLNDTPWDDPAVVSWPLLKKVVPVPQEVRPDKLAVYPEKISIELHYDELPPPFDSDKTLFNTARVGEFWANLLAQNPNHPGRTLRVKRGFKATGFVLADFVQVGGAYKIKAIRRKKDGVTIEAESVLATIDKRKVPQSTSEDNTIQTVGGINNSATSFVVRYASEVPDPTAFSLAGIFIQIDNEILKVTGRNVGTNTLTVTRARFGTTAAAHAEGAAIKNVACFGVDNGAAAPAAISVADALRQILELGGVASADVNTASFDLVKDAYWPQTDILAVLRKPREIPKLIQPLRESRGLILFIDSTGKWALRAMAPGAVSTLTVTDNICIDDFIGVDEDDEARRTRIFYWYDPTDESASGASEYDRAIVVVGADLEDPKLYGDVREEVFTDFLMDPGATTALVRDVATRTLTRNRRGIRRFTFILDLKHGELNVGDPVTVTARRLLGLDGQPEARPCVITLKREVSRSRIAYEALDLNYNGRFLRIAPDTVASDYDNATPDDRSYGYFGDSNNRVGNRKETGYTFW